MPFINKCNIKFMPLLGHADEAILSKRRQLRYNQYDCVFFISLPYTTGHICNQYPNARKQCAEIDLMTIHIVEASPL